MLTNAGKAVYLDSSALVKLIMSERGSEELGSFLGGRSVWVSCSLARVEVIRAVMIREPNALPRAQELLNRLHLVNLDDQVLDRAAHLDPPLLRTLDAIHLAAAHTMRSRLDEFVTYDGRQASGAHLLGFTVIAPGTA